MAESRASRGVNLPSVGRILVIAAALVGAWVVWSGYGRNINDLGDGQPVDSPVDGLHGLEARLSRGADALPELLADLDSNDPAKRRQAAYGLGRLGSTAAQALSKLRELLADDDPRVRENAAYAVANVDPDPSAAAAAITPLMTDAQQNVRDGTEKELLQLGSAALDPILEILHAEETSVRLAVLRLFRNTHGPAYFRGWSDRQVDVSLAVHGLLNDADSGVRIEALTLLAEWRQATLAEVGELLRSDDAGRVDVALAAAASMKAEAAELLPEILALLDKGASGAILHALKSMKAAARPAAPRLIKLSETAGSSDQFEIAQTLAEIGADPDDIARILSPLLLVENKFGSTIGWRAGELLVEVNPAEARRQVSLLLPRLESEDGTVDLAVLYALHTLGHEAHEAVPALVPLLKSKQARVAEFAAHALNRAGLAGVKTIPDLIGIVLNPSRSDTQRWACARALASIGAGAQSTVPALLELVRQPEPAEPRTSGDQMKWQLRVAIVTALGRIGGKDAGLIPALRSQMKSRSHEVRGAAADALGRVAGKSAEVLAELIRLLQADTPIVRAQAALAISRSTADRKGAVAPLIGTLSDENPTVRLAAAVALGQIGHSARDALPVLRERLTVPFDSGSNNGSPSVNVPELNHMSFEQAAQTAIEEIEGKRGKDAR